jgi:hypothetical protein
MADKKTEKGLSHRGSITIFYSDIQPSYGITSHGSIRNLFYGKKNTPVIKTRVLFCNMIDWICEI